MKTGNKILIDKIQKEEELIDFLKNVNGKNENEK